MVRVESVAPNSIAAELGLTPGTELLSVNGREVHDFLDWEFLSADEQFRLLAKTRDPEQTTEFSFNPQISAIAAWLYDVPDVGTDP